MLYDIYKSLISLLLLLLIGGVQAGAKKPAEPLISISGYVFDAVTEEPLKNVKITVRDSLGVVLKDSLALKAYESERSAYDYVVYQDKVPEREKYLITISAPGYATEEFDARISACEKSWGTVYAVDLGNIYLRASRREHSLSEITVTASKVKMIMKGDTIEYDATAFKLPEGSMLDNLIRELPGAQLDDNGRITVNGQFISELLVNGRNFFSGDPQVALRNLPAYTVKNVQVYRREPEAFRGLDVERDKSDDPLIMDVNLKKEYMGGWMANAEFGGGVSLKNARDGRWMGRVFAMRYNKLSFIAFHASANNLNDPDKAGAKGQWSKPQVLAGVTTTKRAGVEYNTSWADQAYCGVNSTFDVVRKTNLTGQSVMGEQFLEGGNTFNRSESSSNRSCWDINWRGEISRMFGKVARVWFATEIDYEKGTSRRSSSSAESNSMLPENFTAPGSADFVKDMLYYRSQRLLGRDLTFGVKSTLFSYIYCTKPGYFGLDANLIYHNSRVKSGNSDQIIYPNGQSNDISLMQNDLMPSRDYDFTIKPQWFMNDYKIGEKKNISWRLSYRYQQKYNFGRRTLEEMNTGREHAPSVLESGSWFLDEANSYHTTRREWNNGVEASFTYDFAKYSISFNGASDYCIRRLEDFRQQTLRHVARNDWKNSVSLSFASGKSWSPGLSWDFNAGFHQELPEMLKLLDVVDSSNPLVVTLGNSNLHREKDYSLSASVNYLLERGLQPRL
ncbi:MAG: hypothetical protein K2K82_10010, partial [Muribaculaceae bacterium]|nr:hypothetical protein [Muribaculaceae bacterium]